MSNHSINRVRLDFSFEQKDLPDPLQETRNYFYSKALPHLLSGFDSIDHYVRIDKLEIDLGKIKPDDFVNVFQKSFRQQWEKAIAAIGKKEFEQHDRTGTTGDPHLRLSDIVHYLEKGYWPWNFQTQPGDRISMQVQSLLTGKKELILLFAVLQNNVFAAERLLKLLVTTGQGELLLASLTEYHPLLKKMVPWFDTDWFKDVKKQKGIYFLLVRQLLTSGPVTHLPDVEKLFTSAFGYDAANPPPAAFMAAIQKRVDVFFRKPDRPAWQQLINLKPMMQQVSEKPSPRSPLAEEGKERINILNAGLILFHSYLPYVFRELKWTDSSHQFISRKTQQKAVFFLQYLVNNKSRQPEHLLVFNKILCGWPLHLSLPKGVNFSPEEKKASADVIDSLKEHWKAVKNTSAKGVISSFVERKGVIEKKGNDYLLQVEMKTIDILLESLPFGLQTVKLPWNEYLIHTEWTY